MPVHDAVALRLALGLSDSQYEIMHRFVPGWLPSLAQLGQEEDRMVKEAGLEPVLAAGDWIRVGWMLTCPAELLKQACLEHLRAGGTIGKVHVKLGTDNFSYLLKKVGTLACYQQVAALPLFDDKPRQEQPTAAGRAGPTPGRSAGQPAAASGQQPVHATAPQQPSYALPIPGPGGVVEYTEEDLLQLGTPLAPLPPDLSDFIASLEADGAPGGDFLGTLLGDTAAQQPLSAEQQQQQQQWETELARMQASWEEEVAKTPDVPFNSPLRAIPLAFMAGKESARLLKVRWQLCRCL
jgi:hypothetical protein